MGLVSWAYLFCTESFSSMPSWFCLHQILRQILCRSKNWIKNLIPCAETGFKWLKGLLAFGKHSSVANLILCFIGGLTWRYFCCDALILPKNAPINELLVQYSILCNLIWKFCNDFVISQDQKRSNYLLILTGKNVSYVVE